MESVMFMIKSVMFYGFEAFVVAVVGAVLVAGLCEIIHDKRHEDRALAPARLRQADSH